MDLTDTYPINGRQKRPAGDDPQASSWHCLNCRASRCEESAIAALLLAEAGSSASLVPSRAQLGSDANERSDPLERKRTYEHRCALSQNAASATRC